MIHKFPQFSKLTIRHRTEITEFTRKFEPYSDFSFVNLYAWNVDRGVEVSWLNDNLVVRIPNYTSEERHIYSIIGSTDLDKSIDTLLRSTPLLELVPELVIKNLSEPHNYAIAEDRSSFDYVYSTNKLATLSGAFYKNKRNQLNQVKQILRDRFVITHVDKINAQLSRQMLQLLKKWQQQANQPFQKLKLEDQAIRRLIRNSDRFNLLITLCHVDGKLVGFSINEVVNKEYSICHFEKTLTDQYHGIGVTVINSAARALAEKTLLVSWEQDLGIDGLKRSKLSYGPVRYHRKYWVSRGVPSSHHKQ